MVVAWGVKPTSCALAQGRPALTATVGEGGWVDLTEPIIVRAGDAFVAVPEPPGKQ